MLSKLNSNISTSVVIVIVPCSVHLRVIYYIYTSTKEYVFMHAVFNVKSSIFASQVNFLT